MLELWHRTFIDQRPAGDPVAHPLVEIGRTRHEDAILRPVAAAASRDDGATPDPG
jgi:hypothetical protein